MGAPESNAGDDFHFWWTVNQVLELVRPNTDCVLVTVEGLSEVDDPAGKYEQVDVAVYRGGEDVAHASAVRMAQLKYSSSHPGQEWTASRLAQGRTARGRNRDGSPARTVIGDLAGTYAKLLKGHSREDLAGKVRIALVSNQPFDQDLLGAVNNAAEWVRTQSTGVRKEDLLAQLADPYKENIQKLAGAVDHSLDDLHFCDFIAALELQTDTPSRAALESSAVTRLADFKQRGDAPDSARRLRELVGQAALPKSDRHTASSHREIRAADVLGALGVAREDDLYPAKRMLPTVDTSLPALGAATVAEAVLDGSKIVIAHGADRFANTAALCRLGECIPKNSAVVLYDCFGAGTNRDSGKERHSTQRFVRQVINELWGQGRAALLIQPDIDEDDLWQQLNRALEYAVKTLAPGGILVLAIDAADEAIAVAKERHGRSFVPGLVGLRLPENVSVVLTVQDDEIASLDAAKVKTVVMPPSADEELGEQTSSSPSALLDPRYRVVPFLGRERELENLVAWCQDGQSLGVRLVTGPGGVGKTRLSVELERRMTSLGWRTICPSIGEESNALPFDHYPQPSPLLIVIDYAENRSGLKRLLETVLEHRAPVRVLMLARTSRDWLKRLKQEVEPEVRRLLSGTDVIQPLQIQIQADGSNDEIVANAAKAFADRMGVECPKVTVEIDSRFVRILDLHAAALVGVLRSVAAMSTQATSKIKEVLEDLLYHEGRFWLGTATRQGLTAVLHEDALWRVVMVGTLLGADSQEEAEKLLARVSVTGPTEKIAKWLRGLYPPDDGSREWLGTLVPDRLAERLVVDVLSDDDNPGLAERCLTSLNGRQALRAVTLLARAVADIKVGDERLEKILPLVNRVVSELPDELPLLFEISNAIPFPSPNLAEAILTATLRLFSLLRAEDDSALEATSLEWLGFLYAQASQPDKALQVTERAVNIQRQLTATDPDKYRARLAGALSMLADRLSDTESSMNELPVRQEAADTYRELAASDPDEYNAPLAEALAKLSTAFNSQGQMQDAVPVMAELTGIYIDLSAAGYDEYTVSLAESSVQLGNTLAALGSYDYAAVMFMGATATYQMLTLTNPDEYLAPLADSLAKLANLFVSLGDKEEALQTAERAAGHYRELTAADPEGYQPDPFSLFFLGTAYVKLRRAGDAVPVLERTATIYRKLAADTPGTYLKETDAALKVLAMAREALEEEG